MKKIILFATICVFASCGKKDGNNKSNNYIIETKVQLQPGKTNEVLKLFKTTNPNLVKDELDWKRATFSVSDQNDIVIVRAEWTSKESYLKFSNSKKFQETMKQFGKHFAGKPKVTINEVLFEM